MIKKLEVIGIIILVVIGLIWGGFEIWIRNYADGEELYNKYQISIQEKNNFKARAFLRLAAKAGNKNAMWRIADTSLFEGDKTNAIFWYKKIYTSGEQFALIKLGNCYVKVNEIANAEKYYKLAQSNKRIQRTANYELLLLYQQFNKQTKLTQLIEDILKSKDFKLINSLGYFLTKDGKHSKAIKVFVRALKLEKNHIIYNNLANCYIQTKNYSDAISYLQKSLKLQGRSYQSSNIKAKLADCYAKIGQIEKSINHYEKSLYNKPGAGHDSNILIRYIALMVKLNKKTECLAFIEKLEKYESIPLYAEKSFYYDSINNSKQGELYFKQGLMNKKINGYLNVSKFYLKTQQYEKALKWSHKFLENYPEWASKFIIEAYCGQKKLIQAINFVDKQINGVNKNYSKALIYDHFKEYKKAIDFYIKASQNHQSFYNQIGDIYLQLKNYNKAVKYYSNAKNFDYKRLRKAYYLQSKSQEKIND
ncbi:tetratricopeptide repeat protein [Lentisphaerota bacterium WC36G]|nr:tetratricopeptide repeat protein [Lentisphaerae bacterium WC36]